MQRVPQSRRFGFWVYVLIIVAVAYTIAVSPASAHALWKLDGTTPPRNVDLVNNLKVGPCGNLPRGNTPSTFQKGSEIMVEWVESIQHNGYFLINFSLAADANFTGLPIKRDANDNNPQLQFADLQNDPIPPGQVHSFSGLITLPDMVCTDCTLQLIQVMSSGGLYYSCADIQLVDNDPNDVTPPADVAGFAAAPGDTLADLSWTNPAADFFQVLVLRDIVPVNALPNTATEYQVDDFIGTAKVIYAGNNQGFQDSGLNNGSSYFYKAFAHDINRNYAAGVATQVTLPAQAANQAPVLNVLSIQNGNDTTTVNQDGGVVEVRALVTDANPGDMHTYNWSNSNSEVLNLDSNADAAILAFDPQAVAPGNYLFDVSVADNGNPTLSASAMLTVTVEAGSTPTPTTSPPPSPASSQAIDTGSGGGCSVAPDARFSPLFMVLLAVAGIYLAYRPRRRVRVRIRRRD